MSSTSRQQLSAFQAFSTSSKGSSDRSKNQSTNNLKLQKSRTVNDVPKSLVDMANEMDDMGRSKAVPQPQRLYPNPNLIKKKNNGNLTESPVKSLLDISFDSPVNQAQRNKTGRIDVKRAFGIKPNPPLSEQITKIMSMSSKLKKKTDNSGEPSPSSNMKPLVVEMKSNSSPKPLLDFSSLIVKANRPMSLLDMSQPPQLIKSQIRKPIVKREIGYSRNLEESRKRKMEVEKKEIAEPLLSKQDSSKQLDSDNKDVGPSPEKKEKLKESNIISNSR